RPRMAPRWTSTAPIGMPPSARPVAASAIAAARKSCMGSTVICGTCFAQQECGGMDMLHMAIVFLVVGLIAALLGFTTIAGASIAIAKFLAGLFLVLFLIFLVLAVAGARRLVR